MALAAVGHQPHGMIKRKTCGQVAGQVEVSIAFRESDNNVAPVNYAFNRICISGAALILGRK